MKIKCKNCGKRFDTEMYSGLCPKCGTYNAPDREEAVQAAAGGQTVRKEKVSTGKSRAFRFPVWLFLFLLLPALTWGGWSVWKISFAGKLRGGEGEIARVQPLGAGELVLEGEPLEYPIFVSAEGVDRVFLKRVIPEGMQLVCVRAVVRSEGYNFDAGLKDVSLKYVHDGDVYYREPVYADAIRTALYLLGISEEEELTVYNPGNGEEDSGYWFFLTEDDAQQLELLLTVEDKTYPSRAVMEGSIPLEGIGSLGLPAGEVED